FFFQAEDGIRDWSVTGVQTCALPIFATAMIVGKPKLRHAALPGTVDHFERPSYLCAGVARRAAEHFVTRRPDLMFVHFSDPDEAGHARGWMSPEYLRAVRESDRCLGQLLPPTHP